MSDTFTWSMSAIEQASAISALRKEIALAHNEEGKLPIGLILDLLPLNTPNAQEVMERGAFAFLGNTFVNKGDAVRIEIFDPVLDTYFLDAPDVWQGTVATSGDRIEINFQEPLALEMPKLAQLGVGRSKFQLVDKISCDPDRLVTELSDTVNGNVTILDVRLRIDASPLMVGLSGKIIGMASSDCPVGDLGSKNWYVYSRRGQDGMCVLHEGETIYGGSVAYDKVFGPATYDECSRYANEHCSLSG